MPELDAMNPEMEPQQTAGTPDGGTDREGAMAKADLYKLANYSHKLFQQMHDDDQLEAWVQAKITKAADYIASVYHYLEYEMKFSEYGHHLDNSDTLSEGQKMRLKEVLAEAKNKMKDLKKTQAEKIKEEKSSTGGEITRSKGVTKHTENPNRYSDEPHGEVASTAKSKSAADKKKEAPALKKSPKRDKTWGMEGGNKFDNRDKELEENMEPCEHCGGAGHVPKAPVQVHPDHAGKVAKYARLKDAVTAIMNDKNKNGINDRDEGIAEAKKKGDGNLANNAKPYDKVTRGDVIAGRLGKDEKGGKTVKEAAKPSAGLSKDKKSAVVKDAKAGKDIGKPGKGFDKLAKKAGGGEKGEKIAAAAMWKNIKETVAYMAEKKAAVKDLPGNQEKIDADHDGKIEKSDLAALRAKKETVKESADMNRLRELTKHLLG